MGISYVRHYSHNNIGNFFAKIILSFLILCIPNAVTKLHAGLPAKPTVVANQQTVNVKDIMYGAKGDGVSDDIAAIQKAVDAVYKRGGGTVYFPKGTYVVYGIKLPANITLAGEGKRESILKVFCQVALLKVLFIHNIKIKDGSPLEPCGDDTLLTAMRTCPSRPPCRGGDDR